MKMVPLDIVDGSYKDEDLSFSAQDTVNYLPTVAEQNGTRTPTMLKTPPGLKPSVLVGVNAGEVGMQVAGPIRGSYNAEGRMFVVAGNQLFQITNAGVSVLLGTVPGVGRVSFSHNQITNGNEILVNNGNSGYIYNTVTQIFQRITDTSYPGGLRAVFINNRFVQIEPARRYLFNSDLADGLSYNALDRFTSETSPDLVMGIESIGNQLAVFSSTTTEWFEDTGANPQPFRSTGIVADKGAAGPFCTAKLDNQLFFLADDGVFYRYQGYNLVRISTKPIEQAIRNKNWFNCFTTVWEDSGYAVCYWTFPDGQTWGYDASTNKWHRRESYGFNRWRLNSLTYWRNRWYGGDFQAGKLYQLDWDYILEGSEEIESIRACGVVSDNQNRVIHERLELVMNTGMVETVPVDFVDQPAGPALSGEAPNGTLDTAYTFTYTTTPGDAPIARTVILAGSTDIAAFGLSWNQATATLSGTPTQTGNITLNLRTYDANGLFANHTDEIQIAALMMATRETGGGTTGYYLRIDGNWSGTWQTNANITGRTGNQLESGDRILSYANGGTVYRTDDYGSTSATSTGSNMGGSGGVRLGWAHNGIVLIAGGVNEVRKSTDNGESFAVVAGSPDLNAIGRNPVSGRWIGFAGNNELWYSDDDGDTWTEGFTVTDATASIYMGRCVHPDGRVFFSCSNGAGNQVKVFSTEDGETIENQTLPAFVDGSVYGTAMHVFGETVIVGTEDGEVAYDDGTGWELSAGSMECFIAQIADNGLEVLMIGGDGAVDANGFIKSTQDLETFTTRLTAALGGTERWVGITA